MSDAVIGYRATIRPLAAVDAFVLRAVPAVSARTLAAGRIIFAGMLLYFWYSPADRLLVLRTSAPKYTLNSFDWVVALAHTDAPVVIFHTITALLVCFLFGVFTRVLYPLLVALFFVVPALHNEGHYYGPLLLALTASLPARWSDAASVDRLLSLTKPLEGRSRIYGYPLWLIGLAIALAYASAGMSKVVLTNGAWMWQPGVRIGFVEDLRNAATDFGLIVVNNYWMAVLASVVVVVGQIAYLYAAFSRSVFIKSTIGLGMAVPFLIGLVLFMGLCWWPWVTLVVMLYLPWAQIGEKFDRGAVEVPDVLPGPRRWALALAIVMLAMHAAAVFVRTDRWEPLVSNYPMYTAAMPFASEAERTWWAKRKQNAYVEHISIISAGVATELSSQYRAVRAANRLLRLDDHWLIRLRPVRAWALPAPNGEVPAEQCSELTGAVADGGFFGSVEIAYLRRYYDLVDGVMSPGNSRSLVIDVAHCRYAFGAPPR